MTEDHYGKTCTFSSGIKVIILPFPALRFNKLVKVSEKKFPIPSPPKKEITVLGGKEEVDDLEDKEYLAKKKRAESLQGEWFNEKTLRICLRDCVQLDISKYDDIIAELEEDNDEPYPESLLKRKVEFLVDYVIRSAQDFQDLVQIATALMQVSKEEVEEQLNSFRGNVEKKTNNKSKSPSSKKTKRMAVQSKA